MSGENAKIKVEAVLDDKVTPSLKDMAKGFTGATKDMTSTAAGLSSGISTLVKGFVGLKVIQEVTGYLTSCAAEGQEAARVMSRLDAATRLSNQAFGMTTKELDKMAGEYQKVSTFGDESIKMAQTQYTLFSNIGKDIFPQLMDATLDVSAAFGDMSSASQTLGRAMEDPIEGTRGLRQMGIFLTNTQEELIKKFLEGGDILSAQKVILDEVTTRFRGMAEAIADTPIGQLDKAKERLGDIKEAAGVNMIPAITAWYNALNAVLDIANKIFFVHLRTKAEAREDSDLEDMKKKEAEAFELTKKINGLEEGTAKWQSLSKSVKIDTSEWAKEIAVLKTELNAVNADLEKYYQKYGISRAGRTIEPYALKPTGKKDGAKAEDVKLVGIPDSDDLNKQLEELYKSESAAYDFSVQMSMELQSYMRTARENELAELDVWYNDKYALALEYNQNVEVVDELYAKRRTEINKKYIKAEVENKQRANDMIIQSTAGLFGSLANLAAMNAKKNRELAIFAKGLAIGEAIINTALAASKANSATPYPPVNAGLMAIAIAQGAIQIAAIASQQFARGGIVSGPRATKDSVPARLTGGEMVLTEAQQSQLFRMANGASSSGAMQADFSITIQGNADSSTVQRIAETREEQLEQFKRTYRELVYRRQL